LVRSQDGNEGYGDVMTVKRNDLLTVNDVAGLLRVSTTTVRNWADDGRLNEYRTEGGHRRFKYADVMSLAREINPDKRDVVLVIDDDDAIRFVIKEALVAVGFDVVEAGSGLQGLDSLDAEPPSLIFLDIMMPGLDGLQVMKQIRAAKVKIPIIAISALGPRVADRAKELGADSFIAKPFEVHELVMAARKLVA
jgi:excisionase family DNA binding protein